MQQIRTCTPYCTYVATVVLLYTVQQSGINLTYKEFFGYTHTHSYKNDTAVHLLLKINIPQAQSHTNTLMDVQFLKTIASVNLHSVKTLFVLTAAINHFSSPYLTCNVQCVAACDVSMSWKKTFPVPALHTISKNLTLITMHWTTLCCPHLTAKWNGGESCKTVWVMNDVRCQIKQCPYI